MKINKNKLMLFVISVCIWAVGAALINDLRVVSGVLLMMCANNISCK